MTVVGRFLCVELLAIMCINCGYDRKMIYYNKGFDVQ
nr:MAG TPA: hypothetical protein [Caudoviricetes sp.]